MQNYQTPVQPVPDSPHPRQSRAKKSNKSNVGLGILAIVLAVIIVASLVVAGWALLTTPRAAKPAATPAQKTETKTDTETEDKTEADTDKDSEKETEGESEGESETSKQPDTEEPLFDFEAMAKGDYSSANGRWKAPNGDVLIVEDDKLTWEHNGKPFRAAYPKNEANDVPKDLQANGFTATNEKDFFKIVWEADKDTPNGIVQIVFVDRPFTDKTIFTYKSRTLKNTEVANTLVNKSYGRAALLIKIDDPDTDKRPYKELGAVKVD